MSGQQSFATSVSRRGRLCVATILFLCASSFLGVVQAQTVFEVRGFSPHRELLNELPFEHIDPFTGNLLLTFTDLELPGNAGFHLRIQRTYNSKIWRDYHNQGEVLDEDSWAGVGWTLHLGRVFHASFGDSTPPIIEMPDGSRHRTFQHISPPAGCSVCFITREYWIYDRATNTLRLPNGLVYDFEHVGSGGGEGSARYVTSITDPFGNSISVTYLSNPSDAISTITQDLGGGQTRQVSFTAGGAYGSLATMTFAGRTWTYTHAAASQSGYSLQTAVTPPIGPGWQFVYDMAPPMRNELTGVTTPNSGVITYTYDEKTLNLGKPLGIRTRVITQRQTSGRDVTSGTWTYQYGQSVNGSDTVITTPCGTTTYTFGGIGYYTSQVPVWSIGLPTRRVVREGTTVLETEDLQWIASLPVSNDDDVVAAGYLDYEIHVPLLSTQTFTRGPRTSTRTVTYRSVSFNDYGQPYQISDAGEFSRTIERSYAYTFSPYVVDRVSTETVSGGGESFTTSYTYDVSTGFMLSRSRYGLTTSFTATARGNVATETNPRLFNTTYNYSWGEPSSIQNPIYPITRAINTDGTVASETRRDFTTTFSYDQLLRRTLTHPPVGNDIVHSYDNTNGETETVSRGFSSTVTTVDGFGRVSATRNSLWIQTDITYDACGRRTHESYPYATVNIGTTITYDALYRVTRRTHPDGSYQSFAYSNGIDVAITDEKGATTTQNWSGFADPDERRLVGVTDPLNQSTTYSYNLLGSLQTATGGGVTREWAYNNQNQLISERHPENGLITYSRDGMGNMLGRTDAKGQSTGFAYDALDRLIQVSYSGQSFYNIGMSYDASDNRTLVSNGFATTWMTYDGANRLTVRGDTINGISKQFTYAHDGNDNVTAIYYPSGRAVYYGYDSENRITGISGDNVTYASEFGYHPSGQIASYRAGNSAQHTQAFDNRYRVSGSNSAVLALTYGYDAAGNVTSIADARPGYSQTFTYDGLDRLTSRSGWHPGAYTYDSQGNMLSKSVDGSTAMYQYQATTNRLTGVSGHQAETFAYDANGNTTVNGSGSYTYTPENMIDIATVGGSTTTYRYDGNNLRVAKLQNETMRTFWRGRDGQVLSEFDHACGASGPSRDYIYAGSRLIAAVRFPGAIPTVSLTTIASSLGEGASSATVGVTLTTPAGSLPCTVNVPYSTTNGSAAAGADYTATAGSLTFAPGTVSGSTQTILVPLIADALDENDETFTVRLTAALGVTMGASTHAVTIVDDDATPALNISDANVVEGNSGAASASFAVSLSAPSGRVVTVNYATANGTALAGRDFAAASGTVTFSPGATSQPIQVSVFGDVLVENTEIFLVNLSNVADATLQDSQGVGTITTNDVFADDPVQAGGTTVRAVHVGELRASINLLRAAYGLGTLSWTDPTVTAGVTFIKAVHIAEMRNALNAVYSAAGLSLPTYTDPSVGPGTVIRAAHINELRAAVKAVP